MEKRKLLMLYGSNEISDVLHHFINEDIGKLHVENDDIYIDGDLKSCKDFVVYGIKHSITGYSFPSRVDIKSDNGIMLRCILVSKENEFWSKHVYNILRNNIFVIGTSEPVINEDGSILTDNGGWNVFYSIYNHIWIDTEDTDIEGVDFGKGRNLIQCENKLIDFLDTKF